MSPNQDHGWIKPLEAYCLEFNVPKENLAEILLDPKVNPMIRGKGFEFTTLHALQERLNPKIYEVSKPQMNAQSMQHDVDILVRHLPSGKTISVECKLSGKGSFKKTRAGKFQSTVKCMRSRTLGEELIKQRAPLMGVSESQLRAHKDSYLFTDFDIVVSSFANAFYETDSETGTYVWRPNTDQISFLQRLLNTSGSELKTDTFNYILVASSSKIAPQGGFIECNRKDCKHKKKCPFIPNYPVVTFDHASNKPVDPWHSINEIEQLIEEILSKK